MGRTALVTLDDLKVHLGIEGNDDDVVLSDLVATGIAVIESELGRAAIPFAAAQSGRVEVHDGTGSTRLRLNYTPAALTSILLGYDAASPDETLDLSDLAQVVWAVGDPWIRRTDGALFGRLDLPRYVQVTYDTQDDFPRPVRTLVLRTAALLYGQRGTEGRNTSQAGLAEVWADTLYADPLFLAMRGEHGRAVFR